MSTSQPNAPTVHSELGASSYKRWKSCPGSVALCKDAPKRSSIYADEGTLAHEIAADYLLNRETKECSDEMFSAIKVYVDYIERLRARHPTFEAVEQKIDLSSYHPKLFGTTDYACYFADTKTLHVVDYKHGAGVAVDVFDKDTGAGNEQLLYYGLGTLHANKFPIKKVVLTIVQPRCYHSDGPVRSWETETAYILDYAADLVEDAIATGSANAPLKTGSYCRWCNAQPFCPKLHEKAVTAAKDVFGSVTPYDPVKLSSTLRMLDQIEAWAKSVRSFAYSEAEAGRIPPGFKLVDKRATRKWATHLTDIDVEGIFGDSAFERKRLSVAQVEKNCCITPDHKETLSKLTVKESSGKNLVEITDDRPEISAKVADVFDIVN